jgi:hypothetical protein
LPDPGKSSAPGLLETMMRILCAILLFLCTLPARAETVFENLVFRHGAWIGNAAYKPDGRFVFCAMVAPYQNRIVMGFSLAPSMEWGLLFIRDGGFPANGPREFHLYVDGRHAFTGTAINADGKVLYIPLPSSAFLMRDMRAGQVLRVVSGYGTSSFRLTGTSQAFVELYNCVQQRSQTAFGGPQGAPTTGAFGATGTSATPSPQPARTGTLDSYRIPRDILLTEMANNFSANGTKDYKFLPHEEFKTFGDVVWQLPDGSLGGVIAFRNIPDMPLAQEEDAIFRMHNAACKGNYASGRRAPGYMGRLEIRKLFTHCEAGTNSAYFEYSLLFEPNARYVRLVTARIGGAIPPKPPADDQVPTQDALLKAFAGKSR